MPKAKRKLYSDSDLVKALSDIDTKTISIRQASIKYGIPKTTLCDKIKGRYASNKLGKYMMFIKYLCTYYA